MKFPRQSSGVVKKVERVSFFRWSLGRAHPASGFNFYEANGGNFQRELVQSFACVPRLEFVKHGGACEIAGLNLACRAVNAHADAKTLVLK